MTDWSEGDKNNLGWKSYSEPILWHCKHQILQWPKMYWIEYILFPLTNLGLIMYSFWIIKNWMHYQGIHCHNCT